MTPEGVKTFMNGQIKYFREFFIFRNMLAPLPRIVTLPTVYQFTPA